MKSDHPIIRNVSSWGLFKHLRNSDGEISEELSVALPPFDDKKGHAVERVGEGRATIASLMKRESTRQHLLVYAAFSGLVIAMDEVFPLYCISKTLGLGITERVIGKIYSGSGLTYI